MDAAARLWRWSGEVYRRPGVAEACLRLQDEHGADVNLALALVWAGAEGIALDAAALVPLTEISQRWQAQVVAPLRGVRRALKGGVGAAAPAAQALREEIKTIELEAERVELELLAAALPRPAGAGGTLARASANLVIYLRALSLAAQPSAVQAAGVILAGAFADARAEDVAVALARR